MNAPFRTMRRLLSLTGCFVLAALCLAASWQSRRLAEMRRTGLPDAYVGYAASAPPVLNFVMAGLGGFRGVIAEVLWFRVSSLQDEGRYLELVQLSNWITLLDPHAAEAWAYNAWNLAYNVSVMMLRHEDRWRWVQSGISLLRDQGLRVNPREARLYRELAWIYQNKVGDNLDNANLTYKLALASSLAPHLNADGSASDTPENRRALSEQRLDLSYMLALEKRWGRLDWRIPDTHAIYWASRGLEFAVGNEQTMCYRALYQPLMVSLLRGRFIGDLASRHWQTAPNLEVALPTAELMREACRQAPSRNMSEVYARYLCLATATLAKNGRPDPARRLYARLCEALPASAGKPTFEEVVSGWNPDHD